MDPTSYRVKVSAVLVALVLFAIGASMLTISGRDLIGERQLRSASARARAEVIEARTTFSTKTGTGHELRYRFQVGPAAYTRSDPTGRRDLWSTLTEEQWNQARSEGAIDVLYLPSDPWVNRPAVMKNDSVGDSVAGMVILGVAPLLLSLLIANRIRQEARELAEAKMMGRLGEKKPDYFTIRNVGGPSS